MAAFQTSRDSRRTIDHMIYTLDLLPQTPLIRDGQIIFDVPYQIRLKVRYSLAEVFNEHWLAAQTGFGALSKPTSRKSFTNSNGGKLGSKHSSRGGLW